MNMLKAVSNRYATKKFATDYVLSQDQFEHIKSLLRFSPSSVNSQPWQFLIAQSPLAKQQMAKAAHGVYVANEQKILDASVVILFCVKTELTDEYLNTVTQQEERDGRFATPENKAVVQKTRQFYADLHRLQWQDATGWMRNQVYLNIGFFLAGIGAVGLDAVPIEGVDLAQLNQEFSLSVQQLSAVALVAVGRRAADDFNAQLPKSRLPEEAVISVL